MKLSPHFTLAEFTRSQTAARKGIDNTPTPQHIHNIERVAYTLEIIRSVLQAPIYISSGYRCQKLNTAIGGSKNSKHMKGLAADFIVSGHPIDEAFNRIRKIVGYDTVILEFGQWIHIDVDDDLRNRALITTRNDAGKVVTTKA